MSQPKDKLITPTDERIFALGKCIAALNEAANESGRTEDGLETLMNELEQLEWQVINTPASSFSALLVKLQVASDLLEANSEDVRSCCERSANYAALASAIRDCERMAELEKGHVPGRGAGGHVR